MTDSFDSWIGSVNIFIILFGGFIAGRLYDRGYLYGYIPRVNVRLISFQLLFDVRRLLPHRAFPLLAIASATQSVLSGRHHLIKGVILFTLIGLPRPRNCKRNWRRDDLRPMRGRNIPPFPEATCSRDDNRSVRLISWGGCPSNHAQSHTSRPAELW
jgi:hypothetical protein